MRSKSEKLSNLTKREQEILKLILEEHSGNEISEHLKISKRTVESHRESIMKKTECKSVIGLVKLAYHEKWL